MAKDVPLFPSGNEIPPVPENAFMREPERVPPIPARGDASSPHTTTPPIPSQGFWSSWFKSAPPPEQPAMDSSREIIETVVFVIVLVLLLKSFVAEAFVIPTGSMAETLYGNQKIVTCPACGILFPVNCSREVEAMDGQSKEITDTCVCPNCFKKIDLHKVEALVNDNGIEKKVVLGTIPGCTSGDRVLVAKFLYDLFGNDPNRLDVVVFKYPGDSSGSGPHFPASGPFRNHTPMNYIKRLIGEPGEVIAIHCGKIYALPPGKAPKYNDLDTFPADKRTEAQENLWQRAFMHENATEEKELFSKGLFNIIRKGPDNVLSMMRIVYDNDHPPKDLEGIVPPRWAGASDQWKADNNHGFTAAASDDKEHWLRYRHYVRDWRDLGEQKKYNHQLISDFMGYNSGYNNFRNEHDSSNGRNWVGDLILETEVTVNQAQGELVFELSKANDRFQARLNLVDGLCRMVRLTETESDPTVTTRELEKQKTSVRKGTYNIRFANVDNRLLLWIDGKLIFPDGVNYDAPLTPIATKKNDLDRPASIAVKGADVQVRHMKLFRDTYYTTNDKDERYPLDNPESWKEMARDKDKDRRPLLTLYVQPDHFLCMGDNSPQSSDSRTWGLVPRRLLLGRALAVYYPFYFPFWPLSSQVNRVGLIH